MTKKNNLIVFLYLALPAIVSTGLIVQFPPDGLSPSGHTKSWLLVLGVLLFLTIFFGLAAILAGLRAEKALQIAKKILNTRRSITLVLIGSGLLFLSASLILAIPGKYLGGLLAIVQRTTPVMTWGLIFSLQVLISLAGWQFYTHDNISRPGREFYTVFGIAFGILAALWLVIATTGLGVIGDNNFWSKVGVPLLWPQILLALGFGVGLHIYAARSQSYSTKKAWFDLGLITLIWLTAVVLWSNQTYIQGTFDTAPRPPANEIYPINDAYIFDSAAQKMLIGRDMAWDVVDKPVFIGFLALFHLLAGSSYTLFFQLQVFFFALIPVASYFLGKAMHSRPLGLIFGILLIFKEKNAIALTNHLQVSTSKMVMSEMLTSLGVLLFTLFIFKWLKSPDGSKLNLCIAGGILGLSSLVRLNSISIIFPITLLIGLAVKFKWQPWLSAATVICIFVVTSALPWMGRNVAVSQNPFSFIDAKTSGVIVNQRYNPVIGTETPLPDSTQVSSSPSFAKYLALGRSMSTNYLHNLVGITLMLPPSLELYKLLDLVRLPYWKSSWSGALLPGAFWVILGILGVFSLGVSYAWRRWRAAGIAPLAVILGYNITTAVSLTSGGRYLVPIDWGFVLYFSLGLFEAALWILALLGMQDRHIPENPHESVQVPRANTWKYAFTVLAFLFLGSTPIIMETLPGQMYPQQVNATDFIKANESFPDLSPVEFKKDIDAISSQPGAVIAYGRALYPRYYKENKGEGPTLAEDPLIGSAGFDHLSFLLAGGKSDVAVVMPTSDQVPQQVAYADTWVIGCQMENYVEPIMAIFRAEGKLVLAWENPARNTCQ